MFRQAPFICVCRGTHFRACSLGCSRSCISTWTPSLSYVSLADLVVLEERRVRWMFGSLFLHLQLDVRNSGSLYQPALPPLLLHPPRWPLGTCRKHWQRPSFASCFPQWFISDIPKGVGMQPIPSWSNQTNHVSYKSNQEDVLSCVQIGCDFFPHSNDLFFLRSLSTGHSRTVSYFLVYMDGDVKFCGTFPNHG